MLSGIVLALGGTYSFMMAKPATTTHLASTQGRRTADDQHKFPSSKADEARVATHQRGH
jgi:hypothetical protein